MRQDSNSSIEQIISEALCREMESVTPPPPDKMWQRISSRLEQAARVKSSSSYWKRAAIAVAAVLVLFVGIAGLYRSPWGR